MEVVSLIIMVLGLVGLVGIYFISRASQKDAAPKRDLPITKVTDANGNERSSIAEDHPARDGKAPVGTPLSIDGGVSHNMPDETAPAFELPPQLILFVAADDGQVYAGSSVLEAFEQAGLVYGEMGLFHRMVLTAEGEASLFRVANGVEPWTLDPEVLRHDTTPGFSLILNLPSPMDDGEAIHDFIRTAEQIHAQVGGTIKDHNQVPFTPEVRDEVLRFLAPHVAV